MVLKIIGTITIETDNIMSLSKQSTIIIETEDIMKEVSQNNVHHNNINGWHEYILKTMGSINKNRQLFIHIFPLCGFMALCVSPLFGVYFRTSPTHSSTALCYYVVALV